MKKTYEKPELDLVEFDAEDVIATSTLEEVDDGGGNEISVNFPFGI